jgi:branched-chain amino acid transport system ATP-binding protein
MVAALVRAVDDISLEVTQGESVAIVGASGCWKSTLPYLLGGLERPTAGTLRVAGRQLERTPCADWLWHSSKVTSSPSGRSNAARLRRPSSPASACRPDSSKVEGTS